jgi:hypothetical protein
MLTALHITENEKYERIEFKENGAELPQTAVRFKVDEAGNEIPVSEINYKFNERGLKVYEEERFMENPELNTAAEYSYDEEDRLIQAIKIQNGEKKEVITIEAFQKGINETASYPELALQPGVMMQNGNPEVIRTEDEKGIHFQKIQMDLLDNGWPKVKVIYSEDGETHLAFEYK